VENSNLSGQVFSMEYTYLYSK